MVTTPGPLSNSRNRDTPKDSVASASTRCDAGDTSTSVIEKKELEPEHIIVSEAGDTSTIAQGTDATAIHCDKTLETILRHWRPFANGGIPGVAKLQDADNKYDRLLLQQHSAETKGITRVPQHARHDMTRVNSTVNFRRKERQESMDTGLLQGVGIRRKLEVEDAYQEYAKKKKLKPLPPSGTIHRMLFPQRVLLAPDDRTLPWHDNNCWWQSFLEMMRRVYEFMHIRVPLLPPRPEENWDHLVGVDTMSKGKAISNSGKEEASSSSNRMANISKRRATARRKVATNTDGVVARSMLGKALAMLQSGDIALESSPCMYIDDAMWAVGAHKTGKMHCVSSAVDALHELTAEDAFLHKACTTEWDTPLPGRMLHEIGPMIVTLESEKRNAFKERFEALMSRPGTKQDVLPNMIFVHFPDAATAEVALDENHHPVKRDLTFRGVSKSYRIVAYIYTDGSHFYPVVLRSKDQILWSADALKNDGILRKCQVGYNKGVHDILKPNNPDAANLHGIPLMTFEKECHNASLICNNMYVREDGHPETAPDNRFLPSQFPFASPLPFPPPLPFAFTIVPLFFHWEIGFIFAFTCTFIVMKQSCTTWRSWRRKGKKEDNVRLDGIWTVLSLILLY